MLVSRSICWMKFTLFIHMNHFGMKCLIEVFDWYWFWRSFSIRLDVKCIVTFYDLMVAMFDDSRCLLCFAWIIFANAICFLSLNKLDVRSCNYLFKFKSKIRQSLLFGSHPLHRILLFPANCYFPVRKFYKLNAFVLFFLKKIVVPFSR